MLMTMDRWAENERPLALLVIGLGVCPLAGVMIYLLNQFLGNPIWLGVVSFFWFILLACVMVVKFYIAPAAFMFREEDMRLINSLEKEIFISYDDVVKVVPAGGIEKDKFLFYFRKPSGRLGNYMVTREIADIIRQKVLEVCNRRL